MNRIKHRLGLRHLRNTANKFHHSRGYIPYTKAKSIGIVYNATDDANREIVTQFAENIESKGKKVKLLGFINKPKMPVDLHSSNNHHFFHRKSLNWTGAPRKDTVISFIQEPFDLLLNLHAGILLPLAAISATSKAHFRIGPYNNKFIFCFDLMFETGNQFSLKEFIKQIEHYLIKITDE
jgi:hypothetical protein